MRAPYSRHQLQPRVTGTRCAVHPTTVRQFLRREEKSRGRRWEEVGMHTAAAFCTSAAASFRRNYQSLCVISMSSSGRREGQAPRVWSNGRDDVPSVSSYRHAGHPALLSSRHGSGGGSSKLRRWRMKPGDDVNAIGGFDVAPWWRARRDLEAAER